MQQVFDFMTPARFAFLLAVMLAFSGTLCALNVSLLTPFSWQNASAWSLNFSVSGNASSCELYTNESGFAAVLNTTSVNASNNSFSRIFPSGVWLWTVSCTDVNETVFAATNATLGVDLVPPSVPALSVSGYNVSWSVGGSDGLSGFSRFELYRNESLVLNTSNASASFFMDLNSTANASYAYRLDSVDVAGNRNSSAAVFEPLSGLFSVSSIQVGPRTFNVSWQTNVAANESVQLFPVNASTVSYASASFGTFHSVNVTTPVFGSMNVSVASCLRQCFGQSFVQTVPPTINTSMTFYDASYNNATAVLSVRWESVYGLTLVSVSTNNSGALYPVVSSTLPGSLSHTENVTFVVNGSAREVVWSSKAVDRFGDSFLFSQSLRLNPNVSRPILPIANASFFPLKAGEDFNVSNGFRLRLVSLSTVPIGPSNQLSAFFETYAPSGELESRFSIEENGAYNTTAVAVRLYRVFLGIGNSSYAQVDAYPIGASATPTPSPEPSATPSPAADPVVVNVTNASSRHSVFSGRLVRIDVVRPPSRNASVLSGYVLSSDDATAVLFNSTYEHAGDSASLFLLVRVKDPASNKTVLVTRSRSLNASDGKALFFSTASVTLAPGDYVADALIVSDDNDRVVDSAPLAFAVAQPGASDAVALVGLLGTLALGVFVFTLKVNHHKKGMFP